MDANYLKQNVNEALAEALTSMAVSLPDDRIEYLGRYLLQYASRREIKIKESEERILADENARLEELNEEALNDTKDLDLVPINQWYPQNYVDGEFKMRPTLLD